MMIADADGTNVVQVATKALNPMFSPDGRKLVFRQSIDAQQDDWALMIAEADGTNVVQVATEAPFGAELGWSFAPDGRSLMAVAEIAGEKRVVILPVAPAAATTVLDLRLPCCWQEIEMPQFRPTNAQEILVVVEPYGRTTRGLYVYDLATGALRTIVEPADDRYVDNVAWLPDGEHITYTLGFETHIVAADGSGDRVVDALRADRLSSLSNDGTRIVIDVAEVDLPGDDSHQRSVVVPFGGNEEPVELACGLGMKVVCAWSWMWSPDDSMLLGTVPHWTSSDRETPLPDTYLQANPKTGQVSELDWLGVSTLDWQRVAP